MTLPYYYQFFHINNIFIKNVINIELKIFRLSFKYMNINTMLFIPTIDVYNGKAWLVKKGKPYKCIGDVMEKATILSICTYFQIVDINRAIGNGENKEIIKKVCQKYPCYVAGGIRTYEDAKEMLNSSARRVVVSSGAKNIIGKIDKARIILACDIDDDFNLMYHGRTMGSSSDNIIDVLELYNEQIEKITITLHSKEGTCTGIDKMQIDKITKLLNKYDIKVILAGGIASLSDIKYLITKNIIPQFGSGFWQGHFTLGQVMSLMLNAEKQSKLVKDIIWYPTIIQNKSGEVLGLTASTVESLRLSIDTKTAIFYSRDRKDIWIKGATSGNTQQLLSVNFCCDNTSVRMVVTGGKFCHKDQLSCFGHTDPTRSGIKALLDRIKTTKNGYSDLLLKNPTLIKSKIIEEVNELLRATNKKDIIEEYADVLYFMLLNLVNNDISFDEIESVLNKRKWKIDKSKIEPKPLTKEIIRIGYVDTGDTKSVFSFLEETLNCKFEIPKKRNFTIHSKKNYFSIIKVKPKDIPLLINKNYIDAVVSFSDIVHNYPTNAMSVTLKPLKQKTVNIVIVAKNPYTLEDLNKQNEIHKLVIMSEYAKLTEEWCEKNKLKCKIENVYGSAESYLVNNLCDMAVVVVDTGTTIKENNLHIVDTITTSKMELFVNPSRVKYIKSIIDCECV